MKKFLLSITVLAVLFAGSCKKLKSLADIQFGVPYKETVDIPELPDVPAVIPPGGVTASIPPIGTATNSEEYIRQYNTSSDFIIEAKLSEMQLVIEQPATQNFDDIDSLWLYISATGLDEVLAAFKYDIPDGVQTVNMDVQDLNLKDYFLQDYIYLRLQGHFYEVPDSTTRLTITTKFDVVANPLN